MRNRYKLNITIILTVYLVPSIISAQISTPISLTTLGSPYTQDFISLSNTAGSTTNVLAIQGWGLTETGGGARDNEQYAVDNGASATGDTYSYGAGATSDRALGSLRSGTLISVFGASFINNTGATITSLDISYVGEEWRLGTAARTDQLDFQYSLNATDLVTGTWTDFDGLDFLTPNIATAGAKDGNIAANRTLKSASITGLTIANGATFLIRWNDTDATGADDGLAVDDFVITPQALAVGPNITAKLTDVISIDNYAPGIANPTDEITYKNTIKNTGTGTANGVTLTETTPTNTTLVPGSEVTSALARNDAYTTGFNTTLSSGNVITNDYGLPLVTVTTFGTVASMGMTTPAGSAGTTTAGGTLTVNSNGTFTYTPPIGYSGTDQFKYIATTGVVGLPNDDAIVSITVNPDITFGTALVDPLCNSGTTGSITFTGVSGGSGSGYTYSITGAAGTYFASPIFLNLAAGTYNLAVKDGAGYIKTGIATLTNPPLLSFTHMDVNNICNGGTAGSITFTATGGTGLLTYSITGSAGTYQNSNVYSGLTGGTYNLAVKDANGCIATGTATLTDPAAVTFTFTKTDITCFGLNNGSIVFNTTTGGSSPYTYSITGTGGTFQVSNSFTGLTAGLKSLVAKDANGCNSAVTSSTVVEPAILVVSGTIPNLIYNVAMATATFSKTGGTGSPATPWSATGLPAGVSINTANGQVTGTPTVTGIFMAVITYTDANGCTDTQNANFNVAPNLQNNAYTGVVGNTQLVSNGHSSPSTPFTSDATNILANDSPAGITITAVTNAATTGGGSITIGTDGKFTYSPPNGSTTADSYVYTGTSNGVSATATINFTIANMVWYVNNTYAGANGTANGSSHRPYTAVDAAATASAINQTIYVHTGSGNTNGNALLKSGQTLRGAGNALSLGALSIVAGMKPTLAGMITLANNVVVDGFGMNTGATAAITSTGATNVTVSISSIITSGAANAVNLNTTTGSITISGGTLSGGTGSVFNVSGGSANIMCSASISQATASQRAINIASATGGTITFNGAITSSGTSTGINLATNTGATINFTGLLTLSTSTNAAFTATGGGTISSTNSGSTITTTTATALNVTNTTIGASNLDFQSISSNGGSATGIILDNTGASGGLTVNGDGGNTSLGGNGTGGSITNKSGSDLSTTTGIGIYLNNTMNVVLRRMVISGTNQNHGIRGLDVKNFTFEYCIVGGTNGTNPNNNGYDQYGEGSMVFGNQSTAGITGTASIKNCIISGASARNLSIVNSSGNLNRITISGCTFGLNQNSSSAGASLSVEARNSGTVLNTTVQSCTFIGSPADQSNFTGQQGTTMDVIYGGVTGTPGTGLGNIVTNSHAQNIIGGCNLTLASQGIMTFDVRGNTFRDANGSAITFFKAQPLSGTPSLIGTFDNNIIGLAGVANSGSFTGNGIFVSAGGTGLMKYTITNNQIHQIKGNAHIYADNTGGSYTANFIIKGNLLDTPGSGWFAGIAVTNGSPTSSDAINVCADIGGISAIDKNTINVSSGLGIIVGASGANIGHTFNLPGFAGPSNQANVESFLQARNTGSFVTNAYVDAPVTFGAFTGNGTSCPLLFAKGGIEGNISKKIALSQDALDKRVAAALDIWKSYGLNNEQVEVLNELSFKIAQLNELLLGEATENTILLDENADENGWYIGEENDFAIFNRLITHDCSYTNDESFAAGRIDLLTTILHEMGHALGLPDTYDINDRENIMFGYLTNGERRLPCKLDVEKLDNLNRNKDLPK